jgi:hypothetical protein
VRDRLLAGGGLLGFFTLRLAAWVCFLVAMASSFVVNWPSGHALPARPPANRQLSVYWIR